MAEDRLEARETDWRQLLPWTVLFQGFRVALDLNKLLLAAGGIVVMALSWWLLAIIFYVWGHLEKRNQDVVIELGLSEGTEVVAGADE